MSDFVFDSQVSDRFSNANLIELVIAARSLIQGSYLSDLQARRSYKATRPRY